MIKGYCYVVCDPLHSGHIEYFKRSKTMCDVLICGVLTDEAVTIKPKPALSFDRRWPLLEAIKYIDLVVPQYKQSPLQNIERYDIDVLFESETHKKFNADAIYRMKMLNKKILYTGLYEGISSTIIKERIIEAAQS